MSIEWPAHGLKLQARIENGTAIIGVIGMGYVGLPLAMAFGEAGCPVLAFDVDQAKIDALE
ncbi:nucleotide sugar dehydrogenase, partial [Escherichia coli]|nr:nucleotide sugar dehydrogenase [Escherichia coli]